MKIVSIEPTPSPHSMKINVSEELADGESLNFKKGDLLTDAPEYIKDLFEIDGIINIYRVVDFITIARQPGIPWEDILPEVQRVLGSETKDNPVTSKGVSSLETEAAFGEVKVYIQMLRGIPMQVKVDNGEEERRFGLPERFTSAILDASEATDNVIFERRWVEQDHVRYGDIHEIGRQVAEEITATYDQARLDQLVKLAFKEDGHEVRDRIHKRDDISLEEFNDSDWRVRYAALDRLDPSLDHLEVLDRALEDDNSSVRRLATAYLGMIEDPEVLPYLYKALKDRAVNVRRTAGDCLSDLGYREAMPEMIKALKDKSQIVRWRAAMFLYELGDESALPALEEAKDDPEYEVRLQIEMAIDRIKAGQKAKGSIWSQMADAFKEGK